jgi:hypothetical protein
MIKHTFFNKCNTIIENSEYNTGLNPVAELNVGNTVSRILINCDLTNLRESVKCGDMKVENLKHVIKMTNCGSVNLPLFNEDYQSGYGTKKRAASFNVIAFAIPLEWDSGRGFDYKGDYLKESHAVTSKDGSSWYNCKSYVEWDEYGVYNNDTLLDEYNKFVNGGESIIIGRQDFDYGTENLEIDVTDYINKILLENNKFYGICLAFAPEYELNRIKNKFISFFTCHTNTFFLPYLETINSEVILDDRAKFHLGVKNRLYLFVTDNGENINLDELPICTIDGKEYEVIHGGKGVYYIELLLSKKEYEPETILYDVWSNLYLNGESIDDIEMEFVLLPFEERVKIGRSKSSTSLVYPQLSGIESKEQIKIGNMKEVTVDFIKEYSYGKKIVPYLSEYRLYVKENDREIEIFPYQTIERYYDEHFFIIDSNDLIPNTYYIDIRVKEGRNVNYFNNVLEFEIVDNVTNFYK